MEPDHTPWHAAPSTVGLAPHQVHVWRAPLAVTERAQHDLWELLDADERERANRFRNERDRRRFVVAHGILRALLAGYAAVPPAELRILSGAHGKPHVGHAHRGAALGFNIAHSGDLALLAFATGRELGVDLEEIDAGTTDPSLAERFFAPGERRSISARPPEERPRTFARLWTLKEAYMKATGLGMSQALNSFEVQLDSGAPALVEAPGADPARGWSLRELNVGGQYAGALCVEGAAWDLCCWNWEPR
jgi:4'-phosphopantetheinyl transferase